MQEVVTNPKVEELLSLKASCHLPFESVEYISWTAITVAECDDGTKTVYVHICCTTWQQQLKILNNMWR